MPKEVIITRDLISMLDVKILNYIVTAKQKEYSLSDITRGVNGNTGNIRPHLEHLSDCGLILFGQSKIRPFPCKISCSDNTEDIKAMIRVYKRFLAKKNK